MISKICFPLHFLNYKFIHAHVPNLLIFIPKSTSFNVNPGLPTSQGLTLDPVGTVKRISDQIQVIQIINDSSLASALLALIKPAPLVGSL